MSAGVLDTTAMPGGSGRVARLAAEAADAARVRALTTDPDVIALRVEKVRSQVDALLWAGIVLGLAFTMVNVQSFAAAGAGLGSTAWWVAWLLDPMVSLVLLAVLRAEQVTARYQVALPPWGRRTKWLTFAATYVMNTWTSWGLDGGELSWSGVVLHSVPPLVVFATAETGPGLRDRLTEAVHRALTEHTRNLAPGPVHRVDQIALDDGQAGPEGPATDDPAAGVVTAYELGLLDEHGLSRHWDHAPAAAPTAQERAAELIAGGAGRRRLARALGVTEYEARQLLARTRGTTAAAAGPVGAGASSSTNHTGPVGVPALNGAARSTS